MSGGRREDSERAERGDDQGKEKSVVKALVALLMLIIGIAGIIYFVYIMFFAPLKYYEVGNDQFIAFNDMIVPIFAQIQDNNNQPLIEIVNKENERYEKVHDSFITGLLMACSREILVVFNFEAECKKAMNDIQKGGLTDQAFDDLEIRYASLLQKFGLDEPEKVTMACDNEVQVLQEYTNLKACAHFMQEYNNLMQKTLDSYKDLRERMCLSKTNDLACH